MDLAAKIRKIEALIAGAKSAGERKAAEFARQRLQKKITLETQEYAVHARSRWEKKLFDEDEVVIAGELPPSPAQLQ